MGERTCSIDGCGKSAKQRGWCGAHYQRWVRHGDPHHGGPLRGQRVGECSVASCDAPTVGSGYCERHYRRWKRYGDPTAGRISPGTDRVDRFMSHVERTPSCWNWTGGTNNSGYGSFKADGIQDLAHRWAFRLAGLALDADLEVDHLCRNRLCVRLDHLEQVTSAENKRRALAANENGSAHDRDDDLSIRGSSPAVRGA